VASILLVHAEESVGASWAAALSAEGYEVTVVQTFAAARAALAASQFQLLIADVRLGPFNGLHLAIQSRALGSPRLIVTHHTRDVVLQREAIRVGAAFVPSAEKNWRVLLDAVRQLLPSGIAYAHSRKWPRLRIERPLAAIAALREAHIVDVSYSGIKLQFDEMELPPSAFAIDVPAANLHLDVNRVWTSGPNPFSCGVAVLGENSGWWTFVDSIAAEPHA
jgi:CheY-like chemotaxis protein